MDKVNINQGIMKTFIMFLCLVLVQGKEVFTEKIKSRHGFWRSMEKDTVDSRRVFGGDPAGLNDYPAVAALLDRYWNIRCSAAVIAPLWALTAAHCVTTRVSYVVYNTRQPVPTKGDHTPVLYLYRHPNYKVVQEDEGQGMDVTLLHHDLGLIRTRDKMKLDGQIKPLSAIQTFSPADLKDKEATVMGFGRTEVVLRSTSEELFAVKLKLVFCERGAWFHCICGFAAVGSERGVCSGDSGGPLIYNGVQVGVTSMGPLECATRSLPAEGATSVFTALYHYVDLINATILDTESTLSENFIKLSPSSSCYYKRSHWSMVSIAFMIAFAMFEF